MRNAINDQLKDNITVFDACGPPDLSHGFAPPSLRDRQRQ
jgi:hypothetical protein